MSAGVAAFHAFTSIAGVPSRAPQVPVPVRAPADDIRVRALDKSRLGLAYGEIQESRLRDDILAMLAACFDIELT